MFQKIIIGIMALTLAVITPMVVLDHTRVATQLQALTDSSYLSYLAVTKLQKKLDFSQIRAATRLLYVPNVGNGSGVMIAPGRMLTAAHVAQASLTYGELILEGKKVKILKVDDSIDLALLEVEADCPCVDISKTAPAVDEPVFIVGFPMNAMVLSQFLTQGRVQGIHQADHRLIADVLVAPGNSGGGAFVLDAEGNWRLVGILVEVMGPYIARSVDTNSINKFLNE